jgi:hypothetical protein
VRTHLRSPPHEKSFESLYRDAVLRRCRGLCPTKHGMYKGVGSYLNDYKIKLEKSLCSKAAVICSPRSTGGIDEADWW